MNQAAQHSGQLLARYEAEEEAQAREAARLAAIKQEPRSGRMVHSRPFGGQDAEWAMNGGGGESESAGNASYDSFARSNPPRRRDVLGEASQSDVSEAWAHHPSMAARAQSVAFDSENQPDMKPILGWYDEKPGTEALKQLATMQARLNQRLGPEYISQRPGGSGMGKVSYLEGWKAIDLANDVFGFNGWSSTIRSLTTDFMDVSPDGRVNCGITAMIRISLRDGTFHDDVGYGHCENIRGKAAALEKAKKEAVTDALKRAMRTFGRLVGNCLYDRKYVDTVAKMRPQEQPFNPSDLYRRQDYAAPPPPAADIDSSRSPVKPEPARMASSTARAGPSAPQAGPSGPRTAPPPASTRSDVQRERSDESPIAALAPGHSSANGRASITPPEGSNANSINDEQERIRVERQALAAQRRATFLARQEEQKREAAAALERQRASVKMEPDSPAAAAAYTTTSPTVSNSNGNQPRRVQPPPRPKRAPAAALPASPPKQVSDDPASQVFAKEPGDKWKARQQQQQQQQQQPTVPGDDLDIGAIGDWDGRLTQEAPQPDAAAAGVKRGHGDSPDSRQSVGTSVNGSHTGDGKRQRM